MVSAAEIPPSTRLAPFVRCFTYREFDTNGTDLIKPWHASHEVTIPFCLNARPLQFSSAQIGLIQSANNHGGVIGSATRYNGELTFNGRYIFFEINLRPGGFTKIFNVPCEEITNRIIHSEDIFGAGVKSLLSQLCGARDLLEMATLAEAYLLGQLRKQKSFEGNDWVTAISNKILRSGGSLPIESLAYEVNMSARSFERHFSESVGLSPKLFSSITRFNRAFGLKLQHPEMGWTSIAHACGYFDQTHMIKDFKRFAGNTPMHFLNQTPLAQEIYTTRVN